MPKPKTRSIIQPRVFQNERTVAAIYRQPVPGTEGRRGVDACGAGEAGREFDAEMNQGFAGTLVVRCPE